MINLLILNYEINSVKIFKHSCLQKKMSAISLGIVLVGKVKDNSPILFFFSYKK